MSSYIPIDNINMCILGCVSAGKSTILNAMFCQDFSESKIKRTTMIPTAFVETRNAKFCQSQPIISEHISKINKQIIEMTERGQPLNLAQFGNHMVFNVDKLDIKISKDFNMTIFDIPGLNDARTKEQYFNYLRNNFYLFNVVLFVVNIESGLNTSDEMDILNLIAEHIEIQKRNGKNIKMLTIANKADEMQLNERTGAPEIVSEELKEMYNQINLTISQVFKKKKIDSHLIGTVPICGVDAHLFRMVRSMGSKYDLNPTQIQRIGTSEMGTRFRSKSPQEQKNIVNKVLSDKTFIDEMIKLSGFERIDHLLSQCMNKEASQMASSNINQELKNLAPISVEQLEQTLIPILIIYSKIKRFNDEDYKIKMTELVKQIHTQILLKINGITDVISIINYYNRINSTMGNTALTIDISGSRGWSETLSSFITGKSNSEITAQKMLEPFHNFNKYPNYLIERILYLIGKEFNENKIPIDKLNYFKKIEDVGSLTPEVVELMLDKIISNPNKVNTFVFSNGITNTELIGVFEKIKNAPKFIQFIRFLIRNKIGSSVLAENIMRLMMYKRYGEIPMYEYLTMKLSNSPNTANSLNDFGYVFDLGISEKDIMGLEIDKYYIEQSMEKCPCNFQYHNMQQLV